MEERLRARLEDFSLGASMALLIILTVVVPLFVLDYSVCAAPAEEAELRMLMFYVTVGIAVIAALVLGVAWAALGSRKLKYSCFFVLVGLATLFAWFVLYFSSPCLASP